jgi:hypothetical protein
MYVTLVMMILNLCIMTAAEKDSWVAALQTREILLASKKR